jgi:hypothetical protein
VCGTPDPLGEVRGTVKGTGWANDILGSRGGASKGVRSTQVSALPLMVSVVVAAYEVIHVDSGQDNCVAHVCATFPEVRIVHSEPRLYPGRARNRSADAAQGQYMAFLPDDGCGTTGLAAAAGRQAPGRILRSRWPDQESHALPFGRKRWVLRRVFHPDPFQADPGQAENSALPFLREALFARLGPFPEDSRTRQGTLFNARCLTSSVSIGFNLDERMAHYNASGMRDSLDHEYEHGRGLIQCVRRHGLPSPTELAEQSTAARCIGYCLYPSSR